VSEELNENVSKLGLVPLSYTPTGLSSVSAVESHTERMRLMIKREAHSEDFIALEALDRVRLSEETRKAEMRRLNRKYGRRKKYKLRYGKRSHHKTKEANTNARKKEYNNKRWETAPLDRLRYSLRKPVDISQDDWDRCVAPVWNQYDRKYLKVKCSAPKLTIHTMVLEYHPPKERYARKSPTVQVVYDGYSQAVYDAMVS
jgi:hypothetical protein